MNLSFDKFFLSTLFFIAVLNSSHFIINFSGYTQIFYVLQIFFMSTLCVLYIKKRNINLLFQIISKLRYFIIFFILNLLLQIFYHNVSLNEIFTAIAYTLSFFSLVILKCYIFLKDENWNFFLSLSKNLFYILIFFGLLHSLGIIQNDIFFTEIKYIENYSFGLFTNTASFLEHQITYGVTIALLFSSFFLSFRINIYNFFIFLLGIFISFSRTSWIAVSLSLIYYFRSSKISWLIILAVIFIFFNNFDSLNQIFRLETGGSGREILWFYAILMLEDNWIFGHGLHSYEYIKNVFLTDTEINLFVFKDLEDLHNTYLTMIFESGIILSFIYFFSIIQIFFQAKKNQLYNILMMILILYLISIFFVEFKLGGLRFFNFYFTCIIGYILSISFKSEKIFFDKKVKV